MSFEQRITLRLSAEEKKKIKEDAAGCCMSVNQYIKYKLFEDEKSAPDSLNQSLLMRIVISGYMHTRIFGLKYLTKEELEKVHKESEEEFRKLNIQKDGCIS